VREQVQLCVTCSADTHASDQPQRPVNLAGVTAASFCSSGVNRRAQHQTIDATMQRRAPQREHAPVVMAHHAQAAHCQLLQPAFAGLTVQFQRQERGQATTCYNTAPRTSAGTRPSGHGPPCSQHTLPAVATSFWRIISAGYQCSSGVNRWAHHQDAITQGCAPQREHAPMVVAHYAQAAHGQRLGAVSLSEDERAQVAVARSGIVGICQLGHTCRKQDGQ
jgi:hypothetical protein